MMALSHDILKHTAQSVTTEHHTHNPQYKSPQNVQLASSATNSFSYRM